MKINILILFMLLGLTFFAHAASLKDTTVTGDLSVTGVISGNGSGITNLTGLISDLTIYGIPRASSATTLVDSGIYLNAGGNVGIGSTAPLALLQVGVNPAITSGSDPAAAIKGNLMVDGNLYGNGANLTIAIDNLVDVSAAAPVKDQVLKWNGTAWVPATYNASFTFSIASFSHNAGSTSVLIGSGTWKAAGAITFTASYNNGPATGGYVSHSGWSNLTLTGAGYVGPTASGEAVSYPASVAGTKVFTLNATDGSTSPTSATTFTFLNYRFYGTTTQTSGFTEEVVEALTSDLSNSTSQTFTVNAGASDYIIYASRAALGARTFTVGGFAGGFNAPETVSITNSAGFTENYYVYRSVNANLGSTTVVVS